MPSDWSKSTQKFNKKVRVKPAKQVFESPLENLLIGLGFVCKSKDAWLKDTEKNAEKREQMPRFHYRFGDYGALTPNHECPFWTVQKWSGSFCHWYVDFPLDVPKEAVIRFMGIN